MMKLFHRFVMLGSLIIATSLCTNDVPTIKTTSGTLRGAEQDGVISFKGIPFGQAPVGNLRWEAPKPFTSHATLDATVLAPPESEDCLFLNVWAPSQKRGQKKAVVVWFYGGGLAFGTGSLPGYDGTSFVKNQDIVIVTTNYRTNAFGFPGAEELFPKGENLGFLDQELTLKWVQENIEAFGGDPKMVTIMGQSAGSLSVAQAIQRHALNSPFRAGIMQSGVPVSMSPVPNFTSFDSLARAVNCTQDPGSKRLACMKAVSADAIHAWTNGPQELAFGPVVDNTTAFANPIERIQQKKTARVPILIGAMQDDGSLFALGQTSLSDFLKQEVGFTVTTDEVRAVYPGLNDTQIIPTVGRDFGVVCPDQITAGAFVQSGEPNVFRYMYGAVFADLQLFPGAGAWHSSEIGEIFGTFNATTATPPEKTLSHTMQTVWANFIKNPVASPAPNWERYSPKSKSRSLAKLAYQGNVQLGNVVQPVPNAQFDGPCDKLWNALLIPKS